MPTLATNQAETEKATVNARNNSTESKPYDGIMLEWIREGMKENIEDLVRMMDLTLHDTVTTSIHNFQKNNMEK